jgi:hypothetical protein
METLAKVFRVNFSENAENGSFLATDRTLSPEPDFFPLPHRHHWMHRSSADNV